MSQPAYGEYCQAIDVQDAGRQRTLENHRLALSAGVQDSVESHALRWAPRSNIALLRNWEPIGVAPIRGRQIVAWEWGKPGGSRRDGGPRRWPSRVLRNRSPFRPWSPFGHFSRAASRMRRSRSVRLWMPRRNLVQNRVHFLAQKLFGRHVLLAFIGRAPQRGLCKVSLTNRRGAGCAWRNCGQRHSQ